MLMLLSWKAALGTTRSCEEDSLMMTVSTTASSVQGTISYHSCCCCLSDDHVVHGLFWGWEGRGLEGVYIVLLLVEEERKYRQITGI